MHAAIQLAAVRVNALGINRDAVSVQDVRSVRCETRVHRPCGSHGRMHSDTTDAKLRPCSQWLKATSQCYVNSVTQIP
jgi:hypothetical protein